MNLVSLTSSSSAAALRACQVGIKLLIVSTGVGCLAADYFHFRTCEAQLCLQHFERQILRQFDFVARKLLSFRMSLSSIARKMVTTFGIEVLHRRWAILRSCQSWRTNPICHVTVFTPSNKRTYLGWSITMKAIKTRIKMLHCS